MKKVFVLASLVCVVAFAFLFLTTGNALAADAGLTVDRAPAQDATAPVTVTVPFLDAWMSSAHADASSEAFRHWDEEDPKEIPDTCAKCHSSTGFQDFLGADGTEAGKVDGPHALGTVVDCVACHNDVTLTKTSVVMPSGIELTGLGDESRCMECHQGRQSKVSVDAAIEKAAVGDDELMKDQSFLNIHYYAAAATKYGTLAKGGYEYDGNAYDGNFAHVDGYDTCIGCHNSHTLEVKVEECATCHEGVTKVEDLRDVRMEGSAVDYDGDGDVEEGIASEVSGLQEALYKNIQAYATEVAKAPIVYDPSQNPYFFADANANGKVDEGEGKYVSWTPRLLKAAYNYQTSIKDPGQYAHGGKYIIQLLFDSIADLNGSVKEPIDMAAMNRNDSGHFDGSSQAFRHWDSTGVVPGSCAKCHSADGLPTYLAEGVNVSTQPANGFKCATCHDNLQEFTLREVKEVKFPSGATLSLEDPKNNLCLSCHQGRESSVSVDKAIGDAEPDEVVESLAFINPHYFAAGATLFGSEAMGMYQYEGKEYAGLNKHSNNNQCTDCHAAHSLEVDWESCTECHEEVTSEADLQNIRYNFVDNDGDGDDKEGLYHEEETMLVDLMAAIQKYAADTAGSPIVFSASAYPYWFIDTNANGTADPEEMTMDNQYKTWTPRLLRGAYNFQWATKDPGSFAHNGAYVLQAVYDSIEDLGGDVSAMTRPE